MLLGLIGSFLPILPGPLTGWLGLLVLHLTNAIPMNWTFLGITLGVALLIWVLDYIIPIPLGFIIGAFVGAFIGEMVFDSTDTKRALKASFGSFLGFLFSTTVKFIISMVFLVFFISKVYDNWSLLIG